jgi:hypothetical protein
MVFYYSSPNGLSQEDHCRTLDTLPMQGDQTWVLPTTGFSSNYQCKKLESPHNTMSPTSPSNSKERKSFLGSTLVTRELVRVLEIKNPLWFHPKAEHREILTWISVLKSWLAVECWWAGKVYIWASHRTALVSGSTSVWFWEIIC